MQIQKKKNKGKRNISHIKNRNSVRIAVLLFIMIHLAFYLTGFLPDQSKYTYSAFRVPQELSGYKTVTLIRWDYAPRDRVMELVFDLKDTSYSQGNIEFSAIYDNTKNLDSQIVYNDQDMLIIQLYKIQEQTGKKIMITFEYTPEGEKTCETSFYSYMGVINEVETLPVLEKDEYYIARQEYDIAYYRKLIGDLEASISKNEASIKNILQDIERLQNSNTNLTTDELLNLNETIQNNQNTIKALEGKNAEYQLKIASYRETIGVLERRKEDYEKTGR